MKNEKTKFENKIQILSHKYTHKPSRNLTIYTKRSRPSPRKSGSLHSVRCEEDGRDI